MSFLPTLDNDISGGRRSKVAMAFSAKMDTAYFLGLAKMDGRVKILLDIDRVLNLNEIVASGSLGKVAEDCAY